MPATTTTSDTLLTDYHLDLICPWCWIGLRNLRTALTQLGQQNPSVPLRLQWHADTLLPHIPEEGTPYQAFYEARLGGADAVAARRAQVRAAAQTVGITLNQDIIATFPNTRKVCTLVNLAQNQLDTPAMFDFVESIFAAYFQQGRDIGDVSTLLELASAANLACTEANLLERPTPSSQHGSGGVPHYVFNQRWSVTGAVPAAELLHHMMQITAAHV